MKNTLNNLLVVNNHYTSHKSCSIMFSFDCSSFKLSYHCTFVLFAIKRLMIKTNKTYYPEKISSHKYSNLAFQKKIDKWFFCLLLECLPQYLCFGSLSPALIRNFKYVRRILTWYILTLFIEKRANQHAIRYVLHFMELKKARFNL